MKPALISLSLVCVAASAQVPEVPAQVTTVQTLGYWQHAGRAGSYRVITTTEGWEHVWSRVFVEWMPEPASPSAPPVRVGVVELKLPAAQGTTVIEATAFRRKVGAVEIKLVARSNDSAPPERKVYRFMATSPGIIKRIDSAAAR